MNLMTFPFIKFADYMFSNEHMNHLITYSFDFRNHDLLSYYISFLRFVIASFKCPDNWYFIIFRLCCKIFVDHVIISCFWCVKSNKWKARQEYNISACKDKKCKLSDVSTSLLCVYMSVATISTTLKTTLLWNNLLCLIIVCQFKLRETSIQWVHFCGVNSLRQ